LLAGASAKLRRGPVGDVRGWAEMRPISIMHEHRPLLNDPLSVVRPNVMNVLALQVYAPNLSFKRPL